jgi:hypothetical protein
MLIELGLLQVTNIKHYYSGQNKSDTVERWGGSLLTGVKTQQCNEEAFSHGRTPARVAASGTSNRLFLL